MVCLFWVVSVLPGVPVQCDGEGVTWEGREGRESWFG